jgi:hypothetical protein
MKFPREQHSDNRKTFQSTHHVLQMLTPLNRMSGMKARRTTCCFDADQDPVPTDFEHSLKIKCGLASLAAHYSLWVSLLSSLFFRLHNPEKYLLAD